MAWASRIKSTTTTTTDPTGQQVRPCEIVLGRGIARPLENEECRLTFDHFHRLE